MSRNANTARGEVVMEVDNASYRLCLTLGALAELEACLGCQTLGELKVRMASLSGADTLVVLQALIRGGGHEVSADELSKTSLSPASATSAIARAFHAALG